MSDWPRCVRCDSRRVQEGHHALEFMLGQAVALSGMFAGLIMAALNEGGVRFIGWAIFVGMALSNLYSWYYYSRRLICADCSHRWLRSSSKGSKTVAPVDA